MIQKNPTGFIDPELIAWTPEAGVPGLYAKTLTRCEETGSYTRLLKFLPGTETSQAGPQSHDHLEELWIVEGAIYDLTLEEKLRCIVHEMYHVSPSFDGDVRRFAGGKPYHTGSQKRYDAAMDRIAQDYLRRTARPELHAFLRHTFAELVEAHGGIVGRRFRRLSPRCIG